MNSADSPGPGSAGSGRAMFERPRGAVFRKLIHTPAPPGAMRPPSGVAAVARALIVVGAVQFLAAVVLIVLEGISKTSALGLFWGLGFVGNGWGLIDGDRGNWLASLALTGTPMVLSGIGIIAVMMVNITGASTDSTPREFRTFAIVFGISLLLFLPLVTRQARAYFGKRRLMN